MRKWLFLLLVPVAALAWPSWNQYQFTDPGSKAQYNARANSIPQQENLVFRADLQSSLAAQVGTSPSFARASSQTCYNAISGNALQTVTSGNPCIPAYPWGGAGSASGVYIGGERKNFLQYSEDWTQAPWANWGSGTFTTASITTPDGATGGMSMVGDNGSGRRQDSGITAASIPSTCSAYYIDQDAGADINATIKATTATEESTSLNLTTTSVWQRNSNTKLFTGAAGGTVECRFTQDDTSGDDWYGWGAMAERQTEPDYGGKIYGPSAYIKTTGATAVTARDNVQYQGSEFGGIGNEVSICVWINTAYELTQSVVANTFKAVLNEDADSFPGIFVGTIANAAVFWFYPGSASANFSRFTFASYSPNTWYQICVVAEYTTPSVTAYVNGSARSLAASDYTGLSAPTWSGLQLGGTPLGATFEDEAFDGIVSRIRVWKSQLSADDVTAIYNAEKGYYQ